MEFLIFVTLCNFVAYFIVMTVYLTLYIFSVSLKENVPRTVYGFPLSVYWTIIVEYEQRETSVDHARKPDLF